MRLSTLFLLVFIVAILVNAFAHTHRWLASPMDGERMSWLWLTAVVYAAWLVLWSSDARRRSRRQSDHFDGSSSDVLPFAAGFTIAVLAGICAARSLTFLLLLNLASLVAVVVAIAYAMRRDSWRQCAVTVVASIATCVALFVYSGFVAMSVFSRL